MSTDVLGRLMMEKLVKKFLYKFADAKDMEDLKSSLAAKDYETAFFLSCEGASAKVSRPLTYQPSDACNCLIAQGLADY